MKVSWLTTYSLYKQLVYLDKGPGTSHTFLQMKIISNFCEALDFLSSVIICWSRLEDVMDGSSIKVRVEVNNYLTDY